MEMKVIGLALGKARKVERKLDKGGIVARPEFSAYFILATRLDRPGVVWVRKTDADCTDKEALRLFDRFPIGSKIEPRWDPVYREWYIRDIKENDVAEEKPIKMTTVGEVATAAKVAKAKKTPVKKKTTKKEEEAAAK
jgi:hypothetical protein